MSEARAPYDPSANLVTLRGKQYLEVKWRLLWLRTEHPDAHIDTELVTFTPEVAVFRARVTLPTGGTATGWGQEIPADFGEYLEKAETKALGRALAALGYGTQFAHDFDAEPKASPAAADPAPAPRPDAIRAPGTKHGRPAWNVAGVLCVVSPKNHELLESVKPCPNHGIPFALDVAAPPSLWGHVITDTGEICRHLPGDGGAA